MIICCSSKKITTQMMNESYSTSRSFLIIIFTATNMINRKLNIQSSEQTMSQNSMNDMKKICLTMQSNSCQNMRSVKMMTQITLLIFASYLLNLPQSLQSHHPKNSTASQSKQHKAHDFLYSFSICVLNEAHDFSAVRMQSSTLIHFIFLIQLNCAFTSFYILDQNMLF